MASATHPAVRPVHWIYLAQSAPPSSAPISPPNGAKGRWRGDVYVPFIVFDLSEERRICKSAIMSKGINSASFHVSQRLN